jgi:uncharacterized protein (DUF362 family)
VVLEASSEGFRRKQDDIDPEATTRALKMALPMLGRKITWAKLFPPGCSVAIKVSCLPGSKLSSSVGLVKGIIACLEESGVSADQIFIWERSARELKRAGFDSHRLPSRVLGTDQMAGGGYTSGIHVHRSIGTCFSRLLERVDSLINVPVIKDHDITGISGGMKNFYGAIHNPNKYHENCGDPFVADLNSHPLIRNKLKLIVADASRVQYHLGPAYNPAHCHEYACLLIGRDPVALDMKGWQIVERLRKSAGLPNLQEERRSPGYIFTAGRLGLGQSDPGKIRYRELRV